MKEQNQNVKQNDTALILKLYLYNRIEIRLI